MLGPMKYGFPASEFLEDGGEFGSGRAVGFHRALTPIDHIKTAAAHRLLQFPDCGDIRRFLTSCLS
jgi:hypothetical protein